MKGKKPVILVVNDDGIHGPGLRPLISALSEIADVTTLVPEKERSAQSHTLTLHKPLRVVRVQENIYKVNGSPADCARLGTIRLLRRRVDLIVSGINAGFNIGHDVVYSGTVAAAMEGAILGIPSIAVSRQFQRNADYGPAGQIAKKIALLVLRKGLPEGACLSVNVPSVLKGKDAKLVSTRLGKRVYDDSITTRADPIGKRYHWLVGKIKRSVGRSGTDVAAVNGGRVSVTPLHVDYTDESLLKRLKTWL